MSKANKKYLIPKATAHLHFVLIVYLHVCLGGVDGVEYCTDEGPEARPRHEVRQEAQPLHGLGQGGAERVPTPEEDDIARTIT